MSVGGITVGGAGSLHDAADGVVRQELEDRGLQAVAAGGRVVHLDVGEALGTVAADIGRVVVDFLAAQLAAARDAQCRDATFGSPAGGSSSTL